MIMLGVDISEHNGDVDFGKVKGAGIDFVILRAGYGICSSQVDVNFYRNYRNAKANGLKIGAYWYSYANTPEEALIEAKVFCEIVKGLDFDLPLYYDIEESNTLKQATANIQAFCNYVESQGYFAGVYANANAFSNFIDTSIRARYTTWLAHWADKPAFVSPMWQNSSTGRIDGIKGYVDTDIANDELVKWVKQSGGGKPDENKKPDSKTRIRVIIGDKTVYDEFI